MRGRPVPPGRPWLAWWPWSRAATGYRDHVPLRLPERIAMCVVAAAFSVLNLLQKLLCTVPQPADVSRGEYVNRYGCWSDVVSLWNQRDLGAHVFPYVFGTYRGDPPVLGGGTVEYPTLTGVWVWVTALFAHSAASFLVVTGVVAALLAVVVTLMLTRIAGRRAWLFAATPPLALYAAYNWDLLPVACTVAGLLVMTAAPRSWPPLVRWAVTGFAFGVGGAFKLCPLMFLAALVLAAFLDRDLDLPGRLRRSLVALGTGVGAVLVANVPFMVVNFEGWLSVFQFQAGRPIGASTLSVWYYGLLPWSADLDGPFQDTMSTLATVSTGLGILVVLGVTVVIGVRTGRTPWIQSSAAMLCVYMVCNKVDSPQYVLWLLPFFVVLRLGGWWIAAYLVTDVALTTGFFRNGYYAAIGQTGDTWASQMMTAGIWVRAALLVVFVVVFLRTPAVRPPSTDRTTTAQRRADVSADAPPAR